MTFVMSFTVGVLSLMGFPQPSTMKSMDLQSQVPTLSVSVLEALVYKTGWVAIGELTKDRRTWATASSPAFDVIGKRSEATRPVLPRAGDQIQLRDPREAVILDYVKAGEVRRLDPPSSIRRSLGPGDDTGLWIPRSEVLQVLAVVVSPAYGTMREVWARVTPPK